VPQLGPRLVARLEVDRSPEQADLLVEGVACAGELRGSTEPQPRFRPEQLDLVLLARPGKVDVFRADGLCIVVCEERRVLVAAFAEMFEPGCKSSVQPAAPRLRQTRVRDLARQRMLERELALAGQRRGRSPADEVPLLESEPVGIDASD
jgi:hypothetical protein